MDEQKTDKQEEGSKPETQPQETAQEETQPQAQTPPEVTKKAPTPPPLPKEVTASTEALEAQLATLQERLNTIERQREKENRTQALEKVIAPLSDTLKTVYRRTAVDTLQEEEYTKLIATIEQEVKELTTEQKTKSLVFGRPTNSKKPETKATDTETAEVLRRLNL